MALSSEQIQQFREHGYTSAPGFFDDRETRAMQAEIRRLQNEGALRNVATEGDGKTHSTTKRNLQLCPMYRHSTLFRALPFQPKVIEAATQLLGDPILLRLDQVFLKPARDGMGTNWHQDNAYFQIADPLKGTAMWIAIHDATVENGTIRVIPDSFKSNLEHGRDPDSDHHIRCYPDESRAVPIELKAGGIAFFCYGTAHATGGNKTDKDRAGVAFHFVHTDYAMHDPQLKLGEEQDYFPFLTGPHATGGVREYGVKVEGTWEREVDQALASAA